MIRIRSRPRDGDPCSGVNAATRPGRLGDRLSPDGQQALRVFSRHHRHDTPIGIVLGSSGGLAYGHASYQAPIGNLTLGIGYAHLRYTLGREFEVLDGSGTADIFSAYASYPLVRSRRANLYALAGVDYKMLRDDLDAVSVNSDKRVTAGSLGLSGDTRDTLGGGGSTQFSVGRTMGSLAIRSPAERAIDAATARSAGGFNKVEASVSRLQAVAGPLSLYGAVRGQLAFDNLDSSEKMELGGAYGVRAYQGHRRDRLYPPETRPVEAVFAMPGHPASALASR